MPESKPSPPVFSLRTATVDKLSKNERLKAESEGLFWVAGPEKHTFRSEVDAMARGEAETVGNEAKELSKFFGIYKQQERSAGGKRDGDHIFMVRLKNPGGGSLSATQWAAIDDAADRFSDGTLRFTSRQGVQFHYVRGKNLGPLVRHLNRGYRPQATLGACGDVNRNVMCCPVDGLDREISTGAHDLAHAIAEELAPRSSAYFQIFQTDEEGKTLVPLNSDEPIYGKQYLPRKFKIGFAPAGDNCVDILTNDIGLVPADNGARGACFELWSGGGLGFTHNVAGTTAHLALYLGRVAREQVVDACRAIVTLQKENGERRDRRMARWKYTIRRLGPDNVIAELRSRFGIRIEAGDPRPLGPLSLHLDWRPQAENGRFYRGISVENGRLRDGPSMRARAAVRRIVEAYGLSVRITPQQDLLLCDVPGERRDEIDRILADHGVPAPASLPLARRLSMACPAKPTCGLAMTEAERVLPSYLDAAEAAGLGDVDVVIRMTGCPNGCARPSTAEIGIVGYGKNDHMIQVGGSRRGTRMGRVLYPRVPEEDIRAVLVGLLRAIRQHANGAPAGDFLNETPDERLRAWVGWSEAPR